MNQNNITHYGATEDGHDLFKEVWSFAIQHSDHTYLVSWALANNGHDEYDYGYLLAFKDGVLFNNYEDNDDISAAVAAAIEFRIVQLRAEYPLFHCEKDGQLSWREQVKNAIESIAIRSFTQEYVGQKSFMGLYVQDVAKILDISLDHAWDMAEELIREKRIGLNDSIFIPFDRYAANQQRLKEQTGHVDFSSYDTEWKCRFCGATGDFQYDPQPQSIECVANKYI
jgi:hypothetical protein